MVLSVHHVALLAHDPQAALAPYQAAGFGVTDGALGTAWVALPNLFIAVHNRHWLTSFDFTVTHTANAKAACIGRVI